jgi:putative oxidoreductase
MIQNLVSRLRCLGERGAALLQPVAPLVTRLVIGEAFLLTGLGKWRNFDSTVAFFTDLGLPAPAANAAFIATLELCGGMALILGLGTRVFAALLAATMVVALLTADGASFVQGLTLSGNTGLTDVVPFVYLMFLVWLCGFGAGPLSVDRIVAGRRKEPAARETRHALS